MGLLEPLLGFPIPNTPAYQIAGKVGLEGFDKIRLEDFQGRSAIPTSAGTIAEEPGGTEAKGKTKPVVTMDLRSNRINLVGPERLHRRHARQGEHAGATPQQRAAAEKANASGKLLPDTPISIPRLDWADIHLRYHGAHISKAAASHLIT